MGEMVHLRIIVVLETTWLQNVKIGQCSKYNYILLRVCLWWTLCIGQLDKSDIPWPFSTVAKAGDGDLNESCGRSRETWLREAPA